MLGDVGEGLGDDEVGGLFDRGREAAITKGVGDADRDGGALREGAYRGTQSGVGQDRGMDAAGQVAQFLQGECQLRARVVQRDTVPGRKRR